MERGKMNPIRYWKYRVNAEKYMKDFFPPMSCTNARVEKSFDRGYCIVYNVFQGVKVFHDAQHDQSQEDFNGMTQQEKENAYAMAKESNQREAIKSLIGKTVKSGPMLQGKSIMDLAKQLMANDKAKRDIVAPVSMLSMNNDGNIELKNGKTELFKPTGWAHQQIASYTEVPKAYYDRLKHENPFVLSENVNHGLAQQLQTAKKENKQPSRLLRTIDGNARAFLSSRYRILDSSDMLSTVMPLMSDKGMTVQSCELTERRMYLKAVSPKLETEVKKGDVVQYGLVLSSSDVGAGSVKIEPMIYRLVCLNGMICPDNSLRQFHIGRDMAALEETAVELFSDATKALSDKAFWSKVYDVVKNSMQKEIFETMVDRLRVAANEPIKNMKLERVIELSTKAVGITGENIKNQILMELIQGGDLSRWGLVNAFTAAAQSTAGINYDDSTELERAGGKVLELSKDQWSTISATA
jgi:hypothetical protein